MQYWLDRRDGQTIRQTEGLSRQQNSSYSRKGLANLEKWLKLGMLEVHYYEEAKVDPPKGPIRPQG